MIRLGLCCLFREVPIKFRSATAKHLGDRAAELATHNVAALREAILYCADHGIGAFRIKSDLYPVATHPEIGYEIPNPEELRLCGDLARQHDIRLSFHPDQFVVLNSPHVEVVENSIRDLEHHAQMAELVGADVINIHAGGAYGDKKSALKRFVDTYEKLSEKIRNYLTIENDDRSYSPADLLPLGIPLCYDVHHHRFCRDELSIEEATKRALETWDREPLFHISSPLSQTSRHHDYISIADMPDCWRDLPNFTLDIEAKAKELAVEKLRDELLESGWQLRSGADG